MSEPAERLAAVRERIRRACEACGRDPESVELIAVTKAHPASKVEELVACGQQLFGENRVQEALAKMEEVGPGPVWHLIGTLQRNKARHAVGRFALIHSVDGPRLARELDKRAAAAGIRQPILLQLNLSGEESKSGVGEDELWPLVEQVAGSRHLDLHGLMTVPPPVDDPEASRPWFSRLRQLRDRAARKIDRELPELSMGMSDDFEVAVAEGATLVRVGRALVGERR